MNEQRFQVHHYSLYVRGAAKSVIFDTERDDHQVACTYSSATKEAIEKAAEVLNWIVENDDPSDWNRETLALSFQACHESSLVNDLVMDGLEYLVRDVAFTKALTALVECDGMSRTRILEYTDQVIRALDK